MSLVPRFDYPTGTEITLFSRKLALNGLTQDGYEVTDYESGAIRVIPFGQWVEYLKLPGLQVQEVRFPYADAQLRLDGYASAAQLPDWCQECARFRLALCSGMQVLRDFLRKQSGDPGFDLSIRKMNEPGNRKFVAKYAEDFFGQKIYATRPPGGNQKKWVMYLGRTLMEYFRVFEDLSENDNPLDALVPLHHRKGNETPRLTMRLRDLMTQAWEEVGLDLKGPSVANVHDHLEMLVHEENAVRRRNNLPPLIVPSHKTLKVHRDQLLSPTEYMLATKGERHARNKRGRGSTDIRALTVGELPEMDECKASLVASAKAKGQWEGLAEDTRAALKEIDEEIRKRLTILVMIDVASRMPLAWIISDQPKAEATLALFRMATRDKTREKKVYGCDGDPVPGTALGNVKNDNGTGLRNSVSKTALVGMGATSTDVRAYNSADKPYIERMFGTTESVLLKLAHGYTGRKPGELPGYDSVANGVLNIDELYGILTRFMIDEYPSLRHYGVGMGGRRPAEVLKELNETRGFYGSLDPDVRRIHLGWKIRATPNDEGVRVFRGLWYSSPTFQEERERHKGKISIFVDPDDINEATALIPGIKEPARLQLQITAFADMTLPQMLNLMADYRREHPDDTVIYEDRIAKCRRQRHEQLKAIGVERRLARSHSTFEECKAKAEVVFGGARIEKTESLAGTAPAGELMTTSDSSAVFKIGDGGTVIDQDPTTEDVEVASLQHWPPVDEQSDAESGDEMIANDHEDTRPAEQTPDKSNRKVGGAPRRLGRPKTQGKLT